MAGGKIQKKLHGGGGGGGGSGGDGARLQGGISFDKSKGQHILRNPALVDSIVEKAGLKPTDTVLEIGSARGTSPSGSSRPASRPSSLPRMFLYKPHSVVVNF
uniref:rRNA adenine N(6)-methyltransferase n=1 Tax=Oryza nivara TaxID=4536 RepID=A0A0E0HR76_ORYNI